MIPINSTWHSKPEVIKGDYGENIIQRHFEKKGYSVYKSVSNFKHPFDFVCIKNNETFYVEVKTKARRNKYPDTGFNFNQYKTYKKICDRENKRMYICFVDPVLRKVYGNFLDILDLQRIAGDNTCQQLYPCIEKARDCNAGTEIIYFPLSVMEDIFDLSNEQMSELIKIYKKSG